MSKFRYFVSYVYGNNGDSRFGRTIIKWNNRVITEDDIESIEELIMENGLHDNVLIMNYIYMDKIYE